MFIILSIYLCHLLFLSFINFFTYRRATQIFTDDTYTEPYNFFNTILLATDWNDISFLPKWMFPWQAYFFPACFLKPVAVYEKNFFPFKL